MKMFKNNNSTTRLDLGPQGPPSMITNASGSHTAPLSDYGALRTIHTASGTARLPDALTIMPGPFEDRGLAVLPSQCFKKQFHNYRFLCAGPKCSGKPINHNTKL